MAVYLRVDGVTDTVIYPLFIGGPADTTNDVHGSETFIMAFEGKEVNQEWHLWVVDRVYDGKEGYIYYWSITIRYDYRLNGIIKYQSKEDLLFDYPLRNVKVVLHEDNLEGPVLDSAFTDDEGRYVMEYEPVDGDIYPVVEFYHYPIADIRDYDDISAGPITAAPDFGDTAGHSQINLLVWKDISLSAAHVWDYIITERQ